MTEQHLTPQDRRALSICDLFGHFSWMASLSYRQRLIVAANRVDCRIRAGWPNSQEETRASLREQGPEGKWWREHLLGGLTWDLYQQGRLYDDLRDYRLKCDLYDLPLCCPHYVRSERSADGIRRQWA